VERYVPSIARIRNEINVDQFIGIQDAIKQTIIFHKGQAKTCVTRQQKPTDETRWEYQVHN
jgi:hypothetical protein